MTWVYFVRQKSEVFSIFKKFQNLVERQSGCLMKVLRSDRGGEYNSNEFMKFCEDIGMQRQFTIGYTPQQNGVAERKNRTIEEMSKSMLHEKGLPKTFWGEAVCTTVYLMNRCPTKALKDTTPFEAWSGRKPSVNHLKVFGCYAHVLKEVRHKHDENSKKCIFVGYSSKSKGYRLFSLDQKKVIICRDVLFDEKASFDWKEKKVQDQSIAFNDESESPQVEDVATLESPQRLSPIVSSKSSPSSTPRNIRSLSDVYARCNLCIVEPENFEEATKDEAWKKAMEDEIHVIEKNKTWELVEKSKEKEIIGVKWNFKTKFNPDGSIQKNKDLWQKGVHNNLELISKKLLLLWLDLIQSHRNI
ncbi:unnamed protein product [Camellia sinensis]